MTRVTDSMPEPGAPLGHFVSDLPFDPNEAESRQNAETRFAEASQRQLMWWQFRKHKIAYWCGIFLLIIYSTIVISEFLAPYNQHTRNSDFIYSPPQPVRLFHDGQFIGPFVYGRDQTLDMETLRRVYTDDLTDVQPLRFFCRGDGYDFWGMIPGNLHFVCPAKDGEAFLLGTDRLGRDVLSRIIYGGRARQSGLAGYHGGWFDAVTQRVIEVLQSIPSIPLWMALAAIIPVTWSPILVYMGITVILGLLDWTGLARAVRSKLLSLREEDYVLAARLMGAGSGRIIGRHMVPGFMSHLIATATLAIPAMILGETALSFLGIGLRPPISSWGILLTEARGVNIIALYPWLLFPVVPVILVVLAFNFLGDGLRDAADPYK